MLIRTLACTIIASACFTQAQAQTFPNPGPYTQDYATAWFTEDIDNGAKLFQYAVINLGTAARQEQTTRVEQPGEPVRHITEWRSDTPMITSYEIPILTQAAWNTIRQDTIFAPDGWSWHLIDPSTTPGAWNNTTGDDRFDSPYRLLQWYVDTSLAPRWPDETIELFIENTAINPVEWLDRDLLAENMVNPEADAKFGGTECGLLLWNEGCAGKGFGFEAEAGKVLGPDEVDWILVTRTGTDIFMENQLPQIGDPDLPVGSNGLSFNGGLALVAPVTAVPEASSWMLMLGGLGILAALRRRKS